MIGSSLVPMDGRVYGMNLPNDGKQIFQILTRSSRQHFKSIFTEYQNKVTRYAEAHSVPRPLFNNDIRCLQIFSNSETELVNRNFDKAFVLLSQLVNAENISGPEKAYILDTLSSIVINHGQKQYLAQADGWSQEALKFAPHSKTLQGTRGVILVEQGKYDEGKQMLLMLTEPGNDAIDVAISSYYLAKIDHYEGNSEQALGWLKRAREAGKQVPGLSEMFSSLD